MRDINDEELLDGDYIRLSRYSENVYQYRKQNTNFKKISGARLQQLKVETFTHNGKMAVVKVDKQQWEKQNQK